MTLPGEELVVRESNPPITTLEEHAAMSVRRHPPLLLAIVVLVAGLLPATGAAAATPTVFDAAPVTTITADGIGGLRLRIPDPSWVLTESGIRIEVQDGTFAYAGLAEGANCVAPDRLMCMQYSAHRMELLNYTNISDLTENTQLRAITYDLYVVTNGRATLTLSFDNTANDDVVELVANAPVDATLERLPRNCPATELCDNLGYGGVRHEVSAPAYVTTISGARHDAGGARSAFSCLYPGGAGDQTSSSDPADYPYGCEDPISGSLTGDVTQFGIRFVDSQPQGSGTYHVRNNPDPDGPVYAGFDAAYVSPLGGGYDAYAVWIDGFASS
jgi:hypothetical protein